MKAFIYYGPGKLAIEERPIPQVGPKDVRVKVKRAGICGSDLTAYLIDGKKAGIWMNGEFGHEMVGVVDQVGNDVRDIREGDRVFVNPAVCKRSGMKGCDIAGAFSEYVLVEDAAYGYNLLRLKENVSFDEGVVIEPLAVGTHAKNSVQLRAHEHVVIFGAGTIGLCTLNAVLATGCIDPVVVDLNRERLKIAESMGAKTFCPEDGELKDYLKNLFGTVSNSFGRKTADVDVFIDCAGAGPILNQMIYLAKNKARIAIVAIYKKKIEFNAALVLNSELTVKGCLAYEQEDVLEAIQNINEKRTHTPEIVTHHFAHKDAIEAFAFAADPSSGAIKVVIDYDE